MVPKPPHVVVIRVLSLKEVPQRGKRKAALAEDADLSTPPKVKREPAERGALMSPPSSKKVLKRKPRIMFTGIDYTAEEEVRLNFDPLALKVVPWMFPTGIGLACVDRRWIMMLNFSILTATD